MPNHTCTQTPCPTCRVDRQNREEWNLEATEDAHQYRTREAYLDWREDTYERES